MKSTALVGANGAEGRQPVGVNGAEGRQPVGVPVASSLYAKGFGSA